MVDVVDEVDKMQLGLKGRVLGNDLMKDVKGYQLTVLVCLGRREYPLFPILKMHEKTTLILCQI